METKQLKEKEASSLATIDETMLQEVSGLGMATVEADQIKVPYLKVLQDSSFQVKKNKPQYIEGAKEGMFCIPISNQLFDGDKGIDVIVVNIEQTLNEYKIVKNEPDEWVENHSHNMSYWAKGKWDKEESKNLLPNGNYLVKSFKFLLFIMDEGLPTPVLFHLTPGQIKKGQQWFNLLRSPVRLESGKVIIPPTFYHVYTLKSATESRGSTSWMGLNISKKCDITKYPDGEELFLLSKNLCESYIDGKVAEDIEDTQEEQQEGEVVEAKAEDLF